MLVSFTLSFGSVISDSRLLKFIILSQNSEVGVQNSKRQKIKAIAPFN
ncbi:MAG: hypothetical protein V7K15_05575 [Nostoc sp.]